MKGTAKRMEAEMLKPIALAAIALLVTQEALANSTCAMISRVAEAGALRTYSDEQIRNGVCLTTKEVVLAISAGNSLAEEICTSAAVRMMKEFSRRFPGENAESALGRC